MEYGINDCRSSGPLLIVAGAGTGKTKTLAHRVARLVLEGTDPQRILLLTFTRRAAAEMTRRAVSILGETRKLPRGPGTSVRMNDLNWSGTFHGIANRVLRLHSHAIGLDPTFTVLDRSDSADLLNLLRNDLGLAQKATRFPKKETCLAIYSHTVNACCELAGTLKTAFPWCVNWTDELKELFRGYVEAKQHHNVLDYDDLLLYWHHMMEEPGLAAEVGGRFDHVLVDEYPDTNALQGMILLRMKPDGRGLTVVGDDAQSIYSFRAATVRNIVDFPQQFSPRATIVTLEQNYRSTQPILNASNAVLSLASEGYTKRLFSTRLSGEKPQFISAADEPEQVQYVVDRILEHREAGIDLKRQAVLFRASHHSAALEVELARRNIPFVKYGGLKFLEAAHVKDVLCALRWAENPRDAVAGFRVLQLLPGIGPRAARNLFAQFSENRLLTKAPSDAKIPPATTPHWADFCAMMDRLRDSAVSWIGQVGLLRQWYQPHLERLYDHQAARAGDLEKLEQISAGYAARERFLTELALDPPEVTGAEAGAPLLDEDYLIFINYPFSQRSGMGRGLHSQSGRWLHTLRYGNGQSGTNRGRTPGSWRRHDASQASPSSNPASSVFPKSATSLRRLLHVCAAEPVHSGDHPRSLRMPGLAYRGHGGHRSNKGLSAGRYSRPDAGDVELNPGMFRGGVMEWRRME